jgi:nucleoside-diphosphate-sugar epimerase
MGVDDKGVARGMYSRAKICAERVLQQMRVDSNLPVVIVRPGIVVGRGGILNHSGIGFWPSDTCCVGWGRGGTPLPFVLVDDVAQAIISALDTPGIEGMCFNLAGDVQMSAQEFVKLLSERSFRTFRFYPQSLWKLQLVEVGKWLLKRLARKRDNVFPSYRDLKSRAFRSRIDTKAAKHVLKWHPNQDVQEFIAEAIDSHITPLQPGDLRLPSSTT